MTHRTWHLDGDGCAVYVRFWELICVWTDSGCLETKEVGIWRDIDGNVGPVASPQSREVL